MKKRTENIIGLADKDERRKTARRHYYVHIDDLAERLGVPGAVVRVWDDPKSGWINFLVADPDGYLSAKGGDVPPQILPKLG